MDSVCKQAMPSPSRSISPPRSPKRKNSSCSRSNKSVRSEQKADIQKQQTKPRAINSSCGSRSISPPRRQLPKKRSHCVNSSKSRSKSKSKQRQIRRIVKKSVSNSSKGSVKSNKRSNKSRSRSPERNNNNSWGGNDRGGDGEFRGRGRGRGSGRGGFNGGGGWGNRDNNNGGNRDRDNNNGGGGWGNRDRDNNNGGGGWGNRDRDNNNNNSGGWGNRDNNNNWNNRDNNNFNNNNNRANSPSNNQPNKRSNSFNNSGSRSPNRSRSPRRSPSRIVQQQHKPTQTPQQQRLTQFYNTHKTQGWFKEKYNPIALISEENERALYIRKAQQEFLADLEGKVLDDINLTIEGYKELGNLQFEENQDGQIDERNMAGVVTLYLKDNVSIEGPPLFGIQKDSATLYIPNVEKEVYRYDLYEIFAKTDGFKSLTLNEPSRREDFKRMAWIQYQTQQKANQTLQQLKSIQVSSKPLQLTHACKRLRKVKIISNYPTSRLQHDLTCAIEIASKLDYETKIYDQNPIYTFQYKSQEHKFDVFLSYLRRVHFFEYFEGGFYDSFRTLSVRSGMTVLRVEAKGEVQVDELTKLDEKLKVVKQKGSTVYRQQAIANIQLFTNILKTHIYQQNNYTQPMPAPKYWPCQQCRKKFLTIPHLVKHIISRHQQLIQQQIQQGQLSIFMKCQEQWQKNKDKRERQEKRDEGRRKKVRMMRDFDCVQQEEDFQIRNRLTKVQSKARRLINFMDI